MKYHEQKVFFFSSRTLKRHGFYVDGKRMGEFKEFSPRGKLIKHDFYVNDDTKPIGKLVKDFPFLPGKPKSTRTRFVSLEVS